MKIYSIAPINHDGKIYQVDQALDVSDKQAKELIELGYATKDKPAKVVAEKTTDAKAEAEAAAKAAAEAEAEAAEEATTAANNK